MGAKEVRNLEHHLFLKGVSIMKTNIYFPHTEFNTMPDNATVRANALLPVENLFSANVKSPAENPLEDVNRDIYFKPAAA